MSYAAHKAASGETDVRCAVVTVSDTRTSETDTSGVLIKARLAEAGHQTSAYHLVPDDPGEVSTLLDQLADKVDVILLSGGTGISHRDTTYEAVAGKLEKTLPGFGELFRMLSYQEIGSGAMLSRAVAGVYRSTLVFSMPGSTGAVRLAMEKLIVPELEHLVWEVARQHR